MPDVAYTEHFRATLHFEDEADTYQYLILFQILPETALSEPESLRFIEEIASEVWTCHADWRGRGLGLAQEYAEHRKWPMCRSRHVGGRSPCRA